MMLDDNIDSDLQKKREAKRLEKLEGVVFLNIASKVRVILLNRRLRELAAVAVPETQVGFRP